MNPNNYCTLEMARRLVEAGIVLETDMQWAEVQDSYGSPAWELNESWGEYPAPSMAEVWRELPRHQTFLQRGEYFSICFLADWKRDEENLYHLEYCSDLFYADNPTDAICELLIWVKGGSDGNTLHRT
jgi:hypothetical protein